MPNQPKPEPTPLERAMRLLSRRGHSAAELTQKLRRAGIPFREAEAAVAECRRLGFVNDETYAQDCAAMLAGRGCGNYRIKLELKKRGVGNFAADALEEIGGSETARAIESAAYKRRLLSRETDPRKLREKIWRFLAGRGFSPGAIRAALDAPPADEDDDFST